MAEKPGETPRPAQGGETIVSMSDSNRALGDGQDLAPGTKVGKYQVRRLLGRGGMGAVYEAVDTLLRRPVALKVLPPGLTGDEQALKRFVREAQLAARLNHVNAVTVYDVGKKGTVYYIAMELVRGTSMDHVLREKGALGVEEATRIVADACRALAAAHAAGLIHRDIKPANILRAEDGTVKLTDFGLAKLHAASDAPGLTVTEKNAILGTPKYMSPEQCQNGPLDARTDLYSLGVTYFALLTGRAPYDGGTAMQILFAHCTQPVPDVQQHTKAQLPPACAEIVRKAMAKRREERYASAAAMLADLDALRGGSGTVTIVREADDVSPGFADLLQTLGQGGAHQDAEGPRPFGAMQFPASRRKASPPWLLPLGLAGGAVAAMLIAGLVLLAMRSPPAELVTAPIPLAAVPPQPSAPPAASAPLSAPSGATTSPSPAVPVEAPLPGVETASSVAQAPPEPAAPAIEEPSRPTADAPPAEAGPDAVERRFTQMTEALDRAKVHDGPALRPVLEALVRFHHQHRTSADASHRELAEQAKALADANKPADAPTPPQREGDRPPPRGDRPPPPRRP